MDINFYVTFQNLDISNISASFDPNGYNKYDYDLYFVDNEILLNNRKYFVNLYDYLPKEHINMYNPKLLPISNNKLYGLVNIFIFY